MKKLLITPEGTFELELTAEEIAQRQLDEQQAIAEQSAREQKIAQEIANKQSALNKLSALGLTEAEIKAIIG
jgi:replicative DNA helicase